MFDRSRLRTVSMAVLAGLCALAGVAQGYSGIEHAWLGIQSWEHCGFWQTEDPAFHQELTKATADRSLARHNQDMLKKFYLIGCMLPDLFTSEGMGTSRWLVRSLYGLSLPDKCPLDIYQSTFNLVAPEDSFVWHVGVDRPNDNLPALRKMVDYAKQQDWSPWEKALIYGAYAHVVMDLHAGYFQQPSLWGKDFVLEPAEARLPEDIDILNNAEMHGNFFEPTYISQFQGEPWLRTMRLLYSDVVYWGAHDIRPLPGACQFYRHWDIGGGIIVPYRAWQDTLFVPEQKFVEAVNATNYRVDNLTPERLHAYLHGYAITWFLICGYPRSNSAAAGGVYSHPDWNFIDVLDYFLDVGTENAFPWVMGDLEGAVKNIMKKLLLRFVSAGGQWYQGQLRIWHPDLQLFERWTYYLEEADQLEDWYIALGPLGLQGEVQPYYERLWSYIDQWSRTSRLPGVDKPNNRSAYRDEPAVARSLMPEMKENVRQGPAYLSHKMSYGFQSNVPTRLLARKAGLVGGIFGDGNTVHRQPGVVNLCFKKDGGLCYSSLDVPQNGDPNYAQLYYDILPFVNQVRVGVVGKTNPADPGQEYAYAAVDNRAYRRTKGEVQFNLTQMAAHGVTRVGFGVYNNSPLQLMLDSDYKGAYDADPRIGANQLYIDWLKGGDPTRSGAENPLSDPRRFWPYVLQLNPVPGYYLSPPTDLSAEMNIDPPAIRLEWTDHSSFENEYEIERVVNHDTGQTTYRDVAGGSGRLWWNDEDIQPGYLYAYRVRATLNDTWVSDWSDCVEKTLTYSDSVPVTAFNNAAKCVVSGNQVHVTYFGQTPSGAEKVLYMHSSDGGRTWDPLEQVSPDNILGLFPSVAVGSSGEPYVLWAERWRWSGSAMDDVPRWFITYNVSWKENGQWRDGPVVLIEGDTCYLSGPPTGFVPPQASFVVYGDSGYLALAFETRDPRIRTGSGVYYSAFPLRDTSQHSWGMLRLCDPGLYSRTPTVLVDQTGRKIVAYSPSQGCVRFWYREATGGDFEVSDVLVWPDYVWNMTAGVENGTNILLAWTSIESDVKFARVVPQPGGGYQLDGSPELVDSSLLGPDGGIRPRFADGTFGMPLLVYEGTDGTSISYAMRVAGNDWRKGVGFANEAYPVSFPQAFVSGSRLTIFCTGTVYLWEPPYGTRYVLLTGSVTLPWYQFPSGSNAYATYPNSGRKLVVQPGGEGVHVVYDAGDSVLYTVSQDDGETWGDAIPIDCGDYPSVALDAAGLPTIVYQRNDTILSRMMRADSSWKDMALYLGSSALPPGTPAVDRLQAAIPSSYPYCAFPCYNQSTRRTKIGLVKLDTLGVTTTWVAESTVIPMDSFVSVACSPDGPICVAWQRANRVMCATFTSGGMPSYVQVADSAIHPFIYVYGDHFYLVWRHVPSGQIVTSSRPVVGGSWGTVSIASPSGDYPVCSKAGTAAWQEWDLCSVNDVWAKVCTLEYNLSESDNISSEYPHMDVSVVGTDSTPVISAIYGIWTENVFDSLYSVRFRKLDLQAQANSLRPVRPSHILFCGQDAASTYCVSRSGCDSSAGVAFDCGGDSLSYLIRYMNPSYNYLAEFTIAPNQGSVSEQSVRVHGEEVARLRFGPGRPNTVRMIVPRRCYERGTTLPLSLRRVTGERVTLAGLKLYAYDAHRTHPEGVMAGATPIVVQPMLYNAVPCPSRGRTVLRYQVPRPMHVTLKIYDATGRAVRTVLDSERPAGVYTLTWDGRDQRGRMSPNGIYFCTMKAGDYNSGKKLVISR